MGVDEVFKNFIFISGGIVGIGAGVAAVSKLVIFFNGLKGAEKKIQELEQAIHRFEQDHILLEQLTRRNDKQDLILSNNSNGMQALLRNQIVDKYKETSKVREISLLDLDSLEHLYKEYKNLDGNGAIDRIMLEMRGFQCINAEGGE